jgi:hypothetical protein
MTDLPTASLVRRKATSDAVDKYQAASNTKILTLPRSFLEQIGHL